MAKVRISVEIQPPERYGGSQIALASLAAIASAIAASASAFLSAARPYLLGISVLCIAYGLYQTWRATQCQRKPSTIGLLLLWVAAVFLAISIFFPRTIANAAADLLSK